MLSNYLQSEHHNTFNIKINLFFAGAVLFLAGLILTLLIDVRAAQGLQIIAIIIFVGYGIKVSEFHFEDIYFKFCFCLLCGWHLYVVFRGADLSYFFIKQYLFSEFVFWPFIIPFAIFLPKNGLMFKKMFGLFTCLGLFFLVFSIAAFKLFQGTPLIGEQAIWTFSSGCGFMLLSSKYLSGRRIWLALIVVMVALLIATLLARRNVMLTNVNYLVAGFHLYFFYYSSGNWAKKAGSLVILILVCVGAFIVFEQKKDQDFKLIINRAGEDTREYVFDYFFDDMSKAKWAGKGMNGAYFCPLFIPDTDSDPIEDRDLIECGYLQIILKGGLVNLILFLAIVLPAVYLGLFRSENGLSKASAVWVIIWLIDMVPYGLPSFSLRYILVWFAIGLCYSKSFRELSEQDIDKIINWSY